MNLDDGTKHILDALSAITVVGTLTTWLPPLAALVSILWTGLRIFEMVTGRPLSDRRSQLRFKSQSEHKGDHKRGHPRAVEHRHAREDEAE